MKNHAKLALGSAVFWGVTALGAPSILHASYITDPLVESVVRGDQPYAFPAGSIRVNQSFDGIVNQVTGDNQVTGNRMINGGTHSFYLRFRPDHQVLVGSLYTVYRRAHRVNHPVTGQYLGELIHRLGVVKVTEVEGALAVAKLVASFNPIGPGDQLARFVAPDGEAHEESVAQASPGMEGRIVDFPVNRTLIGQRHVAYIDRGRADGLHPGQYLQLYRTGGGLPRRTLGEVKVLAVEDQTASVLVTKIIAPLLIGDRVAMKTPVSPQTAEAEALPGVVAEPQAVAHVGSKPQAQPKAQEEPSSQPMHLQHVVVSLNEHADHLYFDSGEAELKPEGVPLLKKLSDLLKQMPEQQIRVEGHADSQEIGPSLKSKFPSNMELSKARAASVARYLAQESGLDAGDLISLGYGAAKPVAPNSTEAGRQKNRRVEIIYRPFDSTEQVGETSAPMTEESLPSHSSGTTLSTVATPSIGTSTDSTAVAPVSDVSAPASDTVADEHPSVAASDAPDDSATPANAAPDAKDAQDSADSPASDHKGAAASNVDAADATDSADSKTSALPPAVDSPPLEGAL